MAKDKLAVYVKETMGIEIPSTMMFDVQVIMFSKF